FFSTSLKSPYTGIRECEMSKQTKFTRFISLFSRCLLAFVASAFFTTVAIAMGPATPWPSCVQMCEPAGPGGTIFIPPGTYVPCTGTCAGSQCTGPAICISDCFDCCGDPTECGNDPAGFDACIECCQN